MKGIAHLAERIAEEYYDTVPKEKTPWKGSDRSQHILLCAKAIYPIPVAPMYTEQDFIDKAKVVKEEIRAQLTRRVLNTTGMNRM